MLDVPVVPMSYVVRLLALLGERGVAADRVLADAGIPADQVVEAQARVSVNQLISALTAGATLTGDPALGLELGLAMKPTSHSWYGYALMSARTLGAACEIGMRYLCVRVSPWRVHQFVEGDTAVMQFEDNVALGDARILVLECFLGGVVQMAEFLNGEPMTHPDLEFWADYAEPPYHARFSDRLPRVRYSCGKLQARYPSAWLDRPLAFAEPAANREAVAALDRELRLIERDDWVQRTRAVLSRPGAEGCADLDAAAAFLRVSSRSLRRHLQLRGTTFHELRDEARRTRAIDLLSGSPLTVDAIARELGYADAAGFSRAFQRWTGRPPSAFRRQRRSTAR